MTTVTFRMRGPRITGFRAEGHSGYAEEGSDIVCAAVTSVVRLAECTVNDVLGLEAPVKVDRGNTVIDLSIPEGLGPQQEETCQTLLAAMMVYFTELHTEYPDNFSVFQEDEDSKE